MLEPQDRQLLLESLRPPEGYELDHALATTFSLDLLALLVAPLAFSLFEWQEQDGEPAPDRMAWLEAIRRYADRLTVFCQAGQIAVPRRDQLLYAYLEKSVFEVTVPRPSGVFHPKVWILRFTGNDQPVRYRVLCLSRNLTFDRSWDTLLSLDGELLDRDKGIAATRGLSDFVGTLPKLTRFPMPAPAKAKVAEIGEEVRRVRFAPPPGFDEVSFCPIGLSSKRDWPFKGRIERMLVVSPFVKESALRELAAKGEKHILVSRLEELQVLPPRAFKAFKCIYTLDADTDETSDDQNPNDINGVPTTGLHAKLYVADDGWNSRVWTGSANATNAAFGQNVEMLVELVGKKSACGIDAMLATGDKELGFLNLLQPFEPAEPIPVDATGQVLEDLLEEARCRIVDLCLRAAVTTSGTTFSTSLQSKGTKKKPLPQDVSARTWPITLADESSQKELDFGAGTVVTFDEMSFEALTAFFAFEVTARQGKASLSRRFVLNLPLDGAPQDRKERILRYLLRDRGQVLRFLLYLLADQDQLSSVPGNSADLVADDAAARGAFDSPALFEQLVRALERDPRRLDEVNRVVSDLRASPDGETLLPDGFNSVWEPLWAARQELAR